MAAVSRMNDHVRELATHMGCKLEMIENCRRPNVVLGQSRSDAVVTIRPIKTNVTYFTALHELGHVNCGAWHPWGDLYHEILAWEWAHDKAEGIGITPSPRTKARVRSALEGYMWGQVGNAPDDPDALRIWRGRVHTGDRDRIPEALRGRYEESWVRFFARRGR
jgi:hypothetical protein